MALPATSADQGSPLATQALPRHAQASARREKLRRKGPSEHFIFVLSFAGITASRSPGEPPEESVKNPFETHEVAIFRHALAQFLAEEVWPHVDEWDEAGAFPWEIHEKAGRLGVFGLGIDEAYGGLGFDNAFMRAALGRSSESGSLGE